MQSHHKIEMLRYKILIILLSVTLKNSRQTKFTVNTYGGYPNDYLDDTYSIQLAINAAIQNGPNNLVLFQSGQYDVNATIGIYGSVNLTISGAGMFETLLLGHSSTQIFACGGGHVLLFPCIYGWLCRQCKFRNIHGCTNCCTAFSRCWSTSASYTTL
jgi:hypothetical protein